MRFKVFQIVTTGILTLSAALCSGQAKIKVSDIYLNTVNDTSSFSVTCYSPDISFNETDIFLFKDYYPSLSITGKQLKSDHKLDIGIKVTPDRDTFGKRFFVIKDSSGNDKAIGDFIIRGPEPIVSRIGTISENGFFLRDTLELSEHGHTHAKLAIIGIGFSGDLHVTFDDPRIKVMDNKNDLEIFKDSIFTKISILKDNPPPVGVHYLQIKSPFQPEVKTQIIVKGAEKPKITVIKPEKFISDGSMVHLEINGTHFYEETKVAIEGDNNIIKTVRFKDKKLFVDAVFPVHTESHNYRLVVINPDGLFSAKNIFTLPPRTVYPAQAIPDLEKTLFFGTPSRIFFKISERKLNKLHDYEITIGGEKYLAKYRNDETLVADNVNIHYPKKIFSYLEKETIEFHIKPVYKNAQKPDYKFDYQWVGTMEVFFPPGNIFTKPEHLILHPGDTLTVTMRGNNLKNVDLINIPPDLKFEKSEGGNDFLTFKATAAKNTVNGLHEIQLSKSGQKFGTNVKIKIKQWQNIFDYIMIFNYELKKWQPFRDAKQEITSDKVISLKFDRSKLTENQLIKVSVTELDPFTFQAKTVFSETVKIEPNTQAKVFPLYPGKRAKPGQQLILNIQTLDSRQSAGETFIVKKRFIEKFSPASVVSLLDIPLNNSGNTEYLRSIGFGVNYMPWNDDFLSFDSYIFIADPTQTESSLEVKVRIGALAVLWKNLKFGVGTNLNNNAFENWYFIIGGGFNFPLPWKK